MISATRLPPSWAWTAGTIAARDNRPASANRSIVVSLLHLRGNRVPHECNLAAAVVQCRVNGGLRRYQPVPAVSVLDVRGLTGPLHLFGHQLTVLVLHGTLVGLGLGLEAANGVQLHAAPIEFQHQVHRRPLGTAEFLRAADTAAFVVRQIG